METTAGIGFLILILFTPWFVPVLVYLFWAYCLYLMAKKTDTPEDWFAWIPILNFYLMCKIAKRPVWWLILFFIPLVDLVIRIIVYIDIAKALRKPEWLAVLTILPIIGLIPWGYLALSRSKSEIS